MAKEDSEPQGKSWKEQWDILSKRGSILTKDVGQMLSDQGKRITKPQWRQHPRLKTRSTR